MADPSSHPVPGVVRHIVRARSRDLGGFEVRRVFPSADCRTVGPYVFFDQIGPSTFPAGAGVDVRPHPHIGLATLTYLFDGEILHRDSLGSEQVIRPGAVNWMVAGRGIVHSQRTPDAVRQAAAPLFGVQVWIALPRADEETQPAFLHHAAGELPHVEGPGYRIRLIAGGAFGHTGPVPVFSPTLLFEAEVSAGASVTVPPDYAERAVHVAAGAAAVAGQAVAAGSMAILAPGQPVAVRATADSRLVVLGGAPLDGPRHVWWNLVSSRRERIEQAKTDWREGRFPPVPGETESIPLPDRPGP